MKERAQLKRILFSQRVEVIEQYNERRDSADQNIARFIAACGFHPIPICNIPELVEETIDSYKPDGFVLTGGEDLCSYGGNVPERDATERFIVEWAIENNTPLLGLCRGMQFIADYFGIKLIKVEGHKAVRHQTKGQIEKEVNSFHNYGIHETPISFKVLAKTDDGVIEAFRHETKAIVGIMWHPERESPFSMSDITLFKELFG